MYRNQIINSLNGKSCISVWNEFPGPMLLLQAYRGQFFHVRVIHDFAPILLNPSIREKVRVLPKTSLDDGIKIIENVSFVAPHALELAAYFLDHVPTTSRFAPRS